MVLDTSICMVFPCIGPMKGLRFRIGTNKRFLHNFCKRFTCWKNINISLAVCDNVCPSCLTWINFIGDFACWAFSHLVLAISSLEHTIMEYANQKKWSWLQVWKNIWNIVSNILWVILYKNITSIKIFHARGSCSEAVKIRG